MILPLFPGGLFPDELLETAFARTPESWDRDGSAESILLEYLAHLENEVIRLGGCLHPTCAEPDGKTCDHGYREQP